MTSTRHFNAEICFLRQNCRPETLVFGDISLVQIFAVFVVQTAIEVAYYAYIVAVLYVQ